MSKSWDLVVQRSVHAPPPHPAEPVNLQTNPKFTLVQPPNLWVENGVIWQLPKLLIGFTSDSSAKAFFLSVKGMGFQPPPASWIQGLPFSASDFPMLYEQHSHGVQKKWTTDHMQTYQFLIWPSHHMMTSTKLFFSMLPNGPFKPVHGHADCAGPIMPTADLRNFSANSPSGRKTFQAQYILYVGGDIPKSASAGGVGVSYDMSMYSWTHTAKTVTQGGSDLYSGGWI